MCVRNRKRDSATLISRLIPLVAVLIEVGIIAFGRMSTKPSMQNLNGKCAQSLISNADLSVLFKGTSRIFFLRG